MNTNGLLIKEEHLAFFEEHDLIFILSIDGNEAMHDAERVTDGGARLVRGARREAAALPRAQPGP